MAPNQPLTHRFLLAMPNQTGTYFDNTLTYICQHSSEGALGLMVNRTLDMTVHQLLTDLSIDVADDALATTQVLEGGPVNPTQGFILHTDDATFESTLAIGGGLSLTTTQPILEAIANDTGPARYLVALGYTGWGPGQLENELVENAWLTCPGDRDVLFETGIDDRLARVTASLGFDFGLMSPKLGES